MFSSTVKIRPRRGSVNEWNSINPVLIEGELAIEYPNTGVGTGDIRIKIGDGISRWEDLPYAINTQEASSIHGGNITEFNKVIAFKHGTTAEWLSVDPILEPGEIGFDTIAKDIKLGDGQHKFSELDYLGHIYQTYDFGDYDEIYQ